jgi:hypothetical protein
VTLARYSTVQRRLLSLRGCAAVHCQWQRSAGSHRAVDLNWQPELPCGMCGMHGVFDMGRPRFLALRA